MRKTAFVTGSTGFVGLNLIEQLLDEGWSVTALHRPQSDVSSLARFAGITKVTGDIAERGSLKGLIPTGVDAVFHVAGNTSLWNRVHAEQLRVNVKGTRNVLRAAQEANAKRVVHVSSIVAYGLHGGTITEETPTRGSMCKVNYVRSKALAEREVRKAVTQGVKAVIVNPANMIGPYDTVNWSRLFRLVEQGRLPAVPRGGGSFAHVKSVARAMIAAAEKGKVGHNYLLGGVQASYLGLTQEMAKLIGARRGYLSASARVLDAYARVEEWVAPLFGREPDVTRDAVALLSENFYCSSKKAERELGYQPQPLDVMLKDCRDWMRDSGLLQKH